MAAQPLIELVLETAVDPGLRFVPARSPSRENRAVAQGCGSLNIATGARAVDDHIISNADSEPLGFDNMVARSSAAPGFVVGKPTSSASRHVVATAVIRLDSERPPSPPGCNPMTSGVWPGLVSR